MKKNKNRKVVLICLLLTSLILGFLFFAGYKTYKDQQNTENIQNIQEIKIEQEATTNENSQPFNLENIPEWENSPFVIVNDNKPFFTEEEKQAAINSFENYNDLDNLKRAQVATASVSIETMPTTKRQQLSYKPTGWIQNKYDTSLVEGSYIYNRCHLIGYQLTAENDNKLNLITGTRYLNIEGMLTFENMIADYVKETKHHVLYRVTPIYKDDNLLASGILQEAYSVEDNGEGIEFCIYAYNVQPGIEINYETGENKLKEKD